MENDSSSGNLIVDGVLHDALDRLAREPPKSPVILSDTCSERSEPATSPSHASVSESTPIVLPKPPPPTPASSFKAFSMMQQFQQQQQSRLFMLNQQPDQMKRFASSTLSSGSLAEEEHDFEGGEDDDVDNDEGTLDTIHTTGTETRHEALQFQQDEDFLEQQMDAINSLNSRNFMCSPLEHQIATVSAMVKLSLDTDDEQEAHENEEESLDSLVHQLKNQINSSTWLQDNPASDQSIFIELPDEAI